MADPIKFTASARIPTRPLSYANKDLAEKKEILVDYDNHRLYVCATDGKIYDITADTEAIINQLIERIKNNPSEFNFGDVTIIIHLDPDDEHPDGQDVEVILKESLKDILKRIDYLEKLLQIERDENGEVKENLNSIYEKIKALEEILKITRDEMGNITRIDLENIFIDASRITLDEEHRFVTDVQITNWNNKARVFQLIAQIQPKTDASNKWVDTDGEAPYVQTIAIPEIKEIDCPIIDILLSDIYAIAMDELNSYAFVYKVTTFDGYIKVYATEPTTTLIKIQIKVDRSGE